MVEYERLWFDLIHHWIVISVNNNENGNGKIISPSPHDVILNWRLEAERNQSTSKSSKSESKSKSSISISMSESETIKFTERMLRCYDCYFPLLLPHLKYKSSSILSSNHLKQQQHKGDESNINIGLNIVVNERREMVKIIPF